ncbi:MAG TPA: GNVR domain-containing protein [Allosphingosinicella sp.]
MDGLYEQIRIALHQIRRRRWLALAVAWGLCMAGWLGIALIPNSYESKARVFAQMQSILPDKIGITAAERQNDLLQIKQMLASTENLQKVVRRTDLNQQVRSERDLAGQVEKLRENIKITAQIDNANVIEISATSSLSGFSNAQNAKTAAAIVQNLLDLFIEENLSGDRAETGQTLGFLDEELRRREAQLHAAEQRRVDFETRYMGLLPGEGSIEQRMGAARSELANVEQQLLTAQSALSAIRSQMGSTPASVATPGFSGGGGYAAAQIARLRPQAETEANAAPAPGSTSPNPAYASMRAMAAEREAQAAAASARKNQIQSAMLQLSQKQSAEPEAAAEQARLNRDYEVLKRQYDKLLEDREQVRLRSDVQSKTDAINFRIIDPPSKPTIPVAPNRPLLLSLILVVAIAGGVAAAFTKGQLQMTFPTQGRLEQATGLPVLGSVSEVLTAAAKAERKQRMKWFAGAGGALAASYGILMLVEFWQRSTVA